MIEEIRGDFLQSLRGFYYVAKHKSLTQACSDMGRTQSTISHQIKCLENGFNITLFDRSKGKMELTQEGNLLLEKTISIFEILKDTKSKLDKSSLEKQGKISIATSHAIIQYFLPQFVIRFKKKSPAVIFQMEGGSVDMILDRVKSAEVDFGIANIHNVPEDLISHTLFETELKVIACKNNPFFSGSEVTLKEITEAPLISAPLHSRSMNYLQRIFRKNDLELNPVLILNNYESIKKYVQLGIGIAVFDSFTLTKQDYKQMDVYSIEKSNYPIKHVILQRTQKYIPPHVTAFLKCIKPDIRFIETSDFI